jgi:endonuclease/exonuclease/phosphatase family metal-dependent hydrolase
MTWNLWWRFGPWEARQPGIAAELKAIDADVVLLQEVWAEDDRDQAAILAEDLGFHQVRSTATDGRPQRFGNAILSRFPLERAGQLTLPSDSGGRGHRSALAAWIQPEALAGRSRQLIVTTHLDWRYDASALRQRQLAAIVDFVVDLTPDDPGPAGSDSEPVAVILGGDFNAQPQSQEIRRLTGLEAPYRPGLVFTDAWAATTDEPGYTWTRDNDNAKDAVFPRRRLDYVFVSWPRAKPYGNPVSTRLAGTHRHGDTVPSDHYAVVAELDDRTVLP